MRIKFSWFWNRDSVSMSAGLGALMIGFCCSESVCLYLTEKSRNFEEETRRRTISVPLRWANLCQVYFSWRGAWHPYDRWQWMWRKQLQWTETSLRVGPEEEISDKALWGRNERPGTVELWWGLDLSGSWSLSSGSEHLQSCWSREISWRWSNEWQDNQNMKDHKKDKQQFLCDLKKVHIIDYEILTGGDAHTVK